MIQPQDLRINNTFLWKRTVQNLPDEYVTIYNITRTTVRAYTKNELLSEVLLNYDDIAPVPLTEEILLKCGAKIQKISEHHWKIWVKDVYLEWSKFDGYSFPFNYDYDGNAESRARIENLHQLQNLYFLLMADELPFDK